MLEGSIMEFVKWWIYMVLLFFALALFMYFLQAGKTTRFEGYVDTQVERYAGLTPEALANIKEENDTFYGGRYTVSIDKTNSSDGIAFTDDMIDEVDDKGKPVKDASGKVKKVKSGFDVMTKQMSYGDVIAYRVDGTYPIMFNMIEPRVNSTYGQAIVQVRGSAGQ